MQLNTWGSLACFVSAIAQTACLDPDEPGNLVPPTVMEDRSLPQIAISGTHLHSEAFGDANAPLVITMHGGPGADYRMMLPLRALADDGYRIVFWDNRGAGLSQRHDASEITFDTYLEDLRQLIEYYTTSPTQPIVFVAQSWGAMYATWFINEYGDYNGRIKGAVLTEPGAFTKAQLDGFMDRFVSAYSVTGEQLNDAFWARQFMSPADHARADYLAEIISIGGPPSEVHDPKKPTPIWRSGAVVSARLFELANDEGFDWTTNLSAYPNKVLFLRGDLNKAATYEHQVELASSYPNADIVTIHNVGHHVMWERADEYLENVRAYFQQIQFTGAAR